uniref:TolC family protein n=1 Tax=Phascolarctobacterium sp. TaxID=2049039 RepID=UPI00386D10BE
MRIPVAIPVLPIVFLSCCSLEQRIADVSENIHHQYTEAKEWDQLPLRVISWEQAVAMMMRCNSEIADTQMAIEEAERDSLSIYTDMIPGVSYYGYFTKSIKQLSDNISANDLNTNVNVTFSIPTLTQVPYRVYAAKAKTFAAVKAREGKERELTAKLYTAVHTRRLQLEGRELETKN